MRNVTIQQEKVHYVATGCVLGNFWGGGTGSYPATKLKSDNLTELKENINKGMDDGSLDSGMGFESLKGAIMEITTITELIIDGKLFINKEYQTEFLGNLTENEQGFLENVFFNN